MPFISGRSTFQRITGALATTPMAPTIGTITASINSPNKINKPTMSQDENNATFTWEAPSVGGVALSVPFTAPAFNGGLPITDYEYSTDNGSTWKSSGSTSSPIAITTVSSSSSLLSANTSYTIRLRAVNLLGTGAQTSGSPKTTPESITSYTVRVYDNYPTNDELVETVTGHSTLSITRSHYKAERDWSVTVAAVNSNGTGTYSDESDNSTGWRYTSYNADYARTRSCTTGAGCASCGTKTGTEDGTVARDCFQWTRTGSTAETGLNCVYRTVPNGTEEQNTSWQGNCRDTGACSGSWSTIEPSTSGRANGSYWVEYAYGNDPRLIVFDTAAYFFSDQNICAVCDCYSGENFDFYTVQRCSADPTKYRWTAHECLTITGP